MDELQFDRVTKALTTGRSRRALVASLTRGGLVALLGAILGEADAFGKNAKKKKRRHHRRHSPLPVPVPPVPVPPADDHRRPDDDEVYPWPPAPPPPSICPGQNETCTTTLGAACCPDIDPNVVCAGWAGNPVKTCQDCTRPMTAAGAFCQDPPGTQCCKGNPNCFVGIRVEDNQPACYSTGVCQEATAPCATDAECGGGLECAHASLVPCECSGTTPTFCGTPCV